MALFEKLKDTKLKSLKFGEKGTVGDSTKPYIVTDINTVDTPFNRLRLTKFDDGLIRGGAIGAINSSAVDTLRISKFLTDFPKGPLFIAKQVGLQLTNSPIETKQLPTNRVGDGIFGKVVAGAANAFNKLNNLVGGPTRIYNLGINTIAQIPLNAFGGHIARHGFLPRLDNSQKYESVVTENNKNGNNRLWQLQRNLFTSLSFEGQSIYANNEQIISNNFGGANSVYGIGRTVIQRKTSTGRTNDIRDALTKSTSITNSGSISVGGIIGANGLINNTVKLEPTSLFIDRKPKTDTSGSTIINTKLLYDPINKRTDLPAALKGIDTITISDDVKNYYISGSKLHYSSVINDSASLNTIFKKYQFWKYTEDDSLGEGDIEKFKYKSPLSIEDSILNDELTTDIKFELTKTKWKSEPTSSFTENFKFLPLDEGQEELIPNSNLRFDPKGENNKNRFDLPTRSPANHIDTTVMQYEPEPTGSLKDFGFLRPYSNPKIAIYNRLVSKGAITSSYSWTAPPSTVVSASEISSTVIIVKKSDISIDRTGGSNYLISGSSHPKYFTENFGKKVNGYDRPDDDIMTIIFTQLNPFNAVKMSPMVFSSYVTGYNENYESNWDSIKYNGRSEFLYTFNSYKKTANFKLKIPSFNSKKLIENHKNLSSLQDGSAGAYLNNRLGGVITYIKLGYYLDDVPCIINSINITIPDEASWDWDLEKDKTKNAYSQLLEANFNITVIGNETPGFGVG